MGRGFDSSRARQYAGVAQLVEQFTCNDQVGSSNLSSGTRKEKKMKKFIYDSWQSVMNAEVNPLKHIPDMQVRHLALQGLAWMWCVVFSVMMGDFMFFGLSIIGHSALIVGVVITVATFETAKRKPEVFTRGN